MKLIVRALAGKCGICFNECFKKTQPKNSYEGGRDPEPERQERSTLMYSSIHVGYVGSNFFRQKDDSDLQHVMHILRGWMKGTPEYHVCLLFCFY